VVGTLLLYGFGLAARRGLPALVGFLVALPFLWYLFGFPRFEYGAALIALSNLVSVIAIGRGHRLLAVIALLPFLATVSWLAYTVLAQESFAWSVYRAVLA
jgi:hypothetical protein